MKNFPSVSAVIVNMNRPDILYPCLETIVNGNKVPVEIWVVAYLYSRENLDRLRADWPDVKIVESNELRGFSENNNLALRQIESEYVFIVNDDTVQLMPVIDLLLEDFSKLGGNVAAVSPKIVFADGSVQTCGRGPWTVLRWMMHYLHLGSETRRTRWTMQDGLFRTWTLNGACFMARTAAFRSAGWFDEAYTFTPEDIALGHKFNDMGYEVYADAGVEITHFAGSSVSEMEQVIKPVRIVGSLIFLSRGRKALYSALAAYAWCVEALRYMKYTVLGCRNDRDRIMKATARNVMRAVFSGKTTKELFVDNYNAWKQG